MILDSDVIIDVLRGDLDAATLLLELESSGVPTYCTAISWAEIYAGLRPGEEGVTRAFFEARGEVVLDAHCGRRAGGYMASFRNSHGVELADAHIAAAASTSGLRLWTRNRRHYPMPDLELHGG